MTWLQHPPIDTVFRRRDADHVDERRLRRSLDSGAVKRIAPGSFVAAETWDAAGPMSRHAQVVWECAARSEPGAVFGCHAAAALWEIDVLGPWPSLVDVVVADTGGGRSSGLIRRRVRRSEGLQVVPWGDHFVTTPAQTVLDLAATRPFAEGVAAMDQGLWSARPDGALILPDELAAEADDYVARGAVRARGCAAFATPLAANVRESQSRVLIHTLGFPRPVLQHRFVLASGRVAYGDFWWPELSTLGELDGMQKYLDPAMLRGRTSREALSDEKDREDELRRVARSVARWRPHTLDRPARFWDILVAAGLPTAQRRPGR